MRLSKSKKAGGVTNPYSKALSPVPSYDGNITLPTKKKDWTNVTLPEIHGPQAPAEGPLTPKDFDESLAKERKVCCEIVDRLFLAERNCMF